MTRCAARCSLRLANLLGPASALAFGTGNEEKDPYRACPGNRECNVLLLDELTPGALGGLLAHYEHRVFVAATLAGVNPFDQFGVKLGKTLAERAKSALKDELANPSMGFDVLIETIRRIRR